MKLSYVIAALVFFLGIGLVAFGMSSTEEVAFLGTSFHPRIAKGAGVIVTIFSIIAFLAAWGGSDGPQEVRRRG
jgi:hypothetical protein